MDDLMIGITEENLDDIFMEYKPDYLVAGRNIKTGAYGLFIIAMDTASRHHKKTIKTAIDTLEDMPDCTVYHALSPYYPPVDLTNAGIVKLAKSFNLVHSLTDGKTSDNIPPDVVSDVQFKLYDLMGLHPNLNKMVDHMQPIINIMDSISHVEDRNNT